MLSAPRRFWCSEGNGCIDLTRPDWIPGTVPVVRPSTAAFICIFPLRLHLHAFWVKLAQCDDWCATGTPLIAANHLNETQTAETRSSRLPSQQIKTQTWIVIIIILSPVSQIGAQLFSHLPSWVVNRGAKSLQICLFIYITSRANINAQFPSTGPSYNAFILCK